MNTLDLLLKTDLNSVQECEVKINRLSKQAGEDVIFALRPINLDRLEELRESNGKGSDFSVMVVLEAVKSPNLKSPELKEKLKAATPAETVKKLLLAGEIEDLYLKACQISGFGRETIEEIKKK